MSLHGSRTIATSGKPRTRAFGSGTLASGSGGRLARPDPSILAQPVTPE